MKGTNDVIELLCQSKNVLVGSHYNPDGDAIGSQLALGVALERMGKNVTFFNRDVVPFNLTFLPESHRIVQKLPQGALFDTAIMVDVAQPDRVGEAFEKIIGNAKLICIDHHILKEIKADASVVDAEACATGEILIGLFKKMNVKLDQQLALYLYTTLVVDTGFFCYSNTSERVLRHAADLVACGVDPSAVATELEQNYPHERFALLAQSLQTLDIDVDLEYASMTVTQAMFKNTGATAELSEEFGNIPRSLKGIEIAALFRELPDGRVKVSLRSKKEFDVAAIARHFHGGGHLHAAGCTIEGPIEAARAQIKAQIKQKKR
ncbi:MAG: hypothetical protein A3I05_10090 [Deltaproteobacteria bacterium RIFCSPLOWO2_02_FULL_44_10]|nr:MAG: hypothetical protein A3C46_08890 [Deltaproteobacteria bacterium RIFCSPHIGHO2_02_FULL_44_16]OGQ45896.1 MAG: hypothetical protein A3I05_10090 [Deltaproteobacteria bacterium RIFCSPLOWO2_02_FULL_44_10]